MNWVDQARNYQEPAPLPVISEFVYLTDLHLVRYREGSGKLFILCKDYTVSYRVNGVPSTYTAPAGMQTDLASIPSIVPKWIAQKVDKHLEAAVIHDQMCIKRDISWEMAAEVFRAGMKAANVPTWRMELMYRAVRLGGPRW